MEHEPTYLADGQSFESRCEGAKSALLEYRKIFTEIRDKDFEVLEQAEAKFSERSSKGGSPVFLEFLERTHNEHKELIRTHSAEMLKVGWEGAISILNVIWGEDAVTFALEAMKYGKRAS